MSRKPKRKRLIPERMKWRLWEVALPAIFVSYGYACALFMVGDQHPFSLVFSDAELIALAILLLITVAWRCGPGDFTQHLAVFAGFVIFGVYTIVKFYALGPLNTPYLRVCACLSISIYLFVWAICELMLTVEEKHRRLEKRSVTGKRRKPS